MANKVNSAAGFNPVQESKDVLDKELFLEAIELICNQDEKMEKFERAIREVINIVCDDSIYFELHNDYYEAAVLLLEHGMHDNNEIISQWLTEGDIVTATYEVNGVRVEKLIETAEELYDYLVDINNWQVTETAEKPAQVSKEETEPLF